MNTDAEILAARLSALEILLFSVAEGVPTERLKAAFQQQRHGALAGLHNSGTSAKIVEHIERTLDRYQQRLGID